MKQIAIVGSGPSGCYLAEQLLRLLPDSTIDVVERMPVPFGLVRYGVAPDHQGTKAVTRLLDRVLSNLRVAFFGNVEVGRDVSLDQLLTVYNAVVLATGALCDRRLCIPGEDLVGVLGSAKFVTWYNAHPEALAPMMKEVTSAVIIGNGNVALDVARILARAPAEFAGSDLPHEVAHWLQSQPLREIHVVGRRAAAEAKFSEHELAEIGTLSRAQPRLAEPDDLTGDSPVLQVLRGFQSAASRAVPITIYFHFSMKPTAFLGRHWLEAVRFRRFGLDCDVPAQLAVTCIGYEASACCSVAPVNGTFCNDEGKMRENLYVVGWAKRGPTGTIPTNRSEAQQLGKRMAREVSDAARPGRAALTDHLRKRGIAFVDYAAWKRIDAAEIACAQKARCRSKFRSRDEMLNAAGFASSVSACTGHDPIKR